MCDYTGRNYSRMKFALLSSQTEIEHTEKEMVEAIKAQNFPLLVSYYRKNGMKNLALNTLLQQRKNNKNIPIIKEIIYTYLYFEDYQGALDYIKFNEYNNKRIKPLEVLIKIHLTDKNKDCGNNVVFLMVKEGLEIGYDRQFVKILAEFYKSNCKPECMNVCIKTKFLQIQEIIESRYLETFDYNECLFLYRMMPRKHVFLKKMVQMNSLIKKKYFMEYANREGLHREDIVRILSAKYRVWAAKIALHYGWIEKSAEMGIEKRFCQNPICINGGDKKTWDLKPYRNHHFYHKIKREKIKNRLKKGFVMTLEERKKF